MEPLIVFHHLWSNYAAAERSNVKQEAGDYFDGNKKRSRFLQSG